MNNTENLAGFLDNFYGEPAKQNEHLALKYKSLYGLPTLSKEYVVNPHIFQHCKTTVNCIVIVLYNQKKEFLIIYSPTMLSELEPVGWRLLGGSLHDGKEIIEEAVNRIVLREINVEVAEIEPIAYIENRFIWDSEEIYHRGLAFVARALDPSETEYGTSNHSKKVDPVDRPLGGKEYKWLEESHLPEKMAFLNKEILELGIEKLKSKVFEAAVGEIQAHKKGRFKNGIHKFLVKPMMHRFASKPLRKMIGSYLGDAKTILDVSAGDDGFILEVAAASAHELTVANDISFGQMRPLIEEKKRKDLNVIFTNHDLTSLPFANPFDVVVFKNTLHHICYKEECLAVFGSLKRLSKRLIIVDIENPKKSTFSARFWNRYYEDWLGDGDDHAHKFHGKDSFAKLINLAFSDAEKIVFANQRTMKGNYMLAVIDIF